MLGVLALASFVIAAVIFFLLAIEEVTWHLAWGFFFVALGFVIDHLGAAYVSVRQAQQTN